MWQRSHLHSSKTEGSLEKGVKQRPLKIIYGPHKINETSSSFSFLKLFLPLWILYRLTMQDFTQEMELHWLLDIVTITLWHLYRTFPNLAKNAILLCRVYCLATKHHLVTIFWPGPKVSYNQCILNAVWEMSYCKMEGPLPNIIRNNSNSGLKFWIATRYTEAKVDVTQEIEQRAQWSAPAWAACCALCSISCVTSTLASVYFPLLI